MTKAYAIPLPQILNIDVLNTIAFTTLFFNGEATQSNNRLEHLNVHKSRALQPSQPFVLQVNTTRHKNVETVTCLRLKER